MPVRLCAARKAARGSLQHPTSHVWISDQVLQDTLNSFTARISGCKRHGSHVPGPLEARRRLAKRQLGHLSAVGQAGSPPVDPALLTFGWFGNTRGTSAEQDIRWLPPGAQGPIRTGKHAYPKLPSWLDVKHPSSDTSSLDLDQILGPQPQLNEVTVSQYKLRLSCTNNVEDIRRLNEELGNAILDAERCSMAAFNHLLARYTVIRNANGAQDTAVRAHRNELFQFLQDPQLERSNLRNLHTFVSMLASEDATAKDVLYVFQQLKASASSLGSSNVLADLLKLALTLAERLEKRDMIPEALQDIWRATKETKKRGKIGRVLLCYLTDVASEPNAMALASDVLQSLRPTVDYAHPLEVDGKENASSWRRCIGAFARSLMVQDEAQEDVLLNYEATANAKQSSKMSSLLRSLPHEYTGTFAAAVTLTLVEDLQTSTEGNIAMTRLRTWSQTFRSTAKRQWTVALPKATMDNIHRRIAEVAEPAEATFVFEPMNGAQIAETLLQHWLAKNKTTYAPLEANAPVAANAHRAATLRKTWHESRAYLERVAAEWMNPFQIALVALVDASKLHQLNWEALLDDILGLLQSLGRKQDFVKVAAGWKRMQHGSCFTVKHRSRLAEFIDQCGTDDAFRALKLFNLDKRNFLSEYPALVDKLLQCSVVRSEDILPLLLRHDRHLRQPVVDQKHSSNRKLTTERVELVQALALELATNERFSLRQASSGVHFCWKYLKSNQAPLDKRMVEAAVIAGILRPFAAGQWVPRRQLKWVGKVVEELCGIEAVKDLDRLAFDMRPKLSYEMLGHSCRSEDQVQAGQSIDWRSLAVPKTWQKGFIGPQNLASTKRTKVVAGSVAKAGT